MDLLRRNLFLIICGAVGAAGIGLIVTGVRGMPNVIDAMQDTKRLYQELKSLQNKPVNQRAIDAERARIKLTIEDRDQIIHKTMQLYGYEPLVPGVFPNGDDDARRRFRKEYETSMGKLFASLHGGQPAGEAEIDVMKDKIADEEYRAAKLGPNAFDRGDTGPETGPPRTNAGVLTRAGARSDPEARAHMAMAQRSQCYAVDFKYANPPKRYASLEFDPTMVDTGTVDAPLLEDVWRAQLSYWLQKDVVEAIVAVNEEAAVEAKNRREEAWVGNAPVKDVISVRVSDEYVLPDAGEFAGASAGGEAEALPPGTGLTVFTGSESTALFEAMQFTVKLVMDQRDIPKLVDRICANRFHTLLRVAYEAVGPNRDMRGKVYGSEPAVNVVMDFETILLGEAFRPLMPLVVCERLSDAGYGIECPEPEDE